MPNLHIRCRCRLRGIGSPETGEEVTDMDVSRSRVLVAGATGALGAALCRMLSDLGARLALAGRDSERLGTVSRATATKNGRPAPSRRMDAYDLDGCAALPDWAAQEPGGLDAVVVTTGVAAFGRCHDMPDTVAEHLMTVNALAPMAILRAAVPLPADGGVLAAISGVIARSPQPGMADYSASKGALSSWLTALRAELGAGGPQVLDARLPHLDTGFADRAVHGSPPPLPAPVPAADAVQAVISALTEGAGVLRPRPGGGFTTS